MGIKMPQIGDIVLYFAYGTPKGEFKPNEQRAAIVTAIHGYDDISLAVINPTGLFFNSHIKHFNPENISGHWAWREEI